MLYLEGFIEPKGKPFFNIPFNYDAVMKRYFDTVSAWDNRVSA